jgi:hypothetical protein
MIRLYNDYLKRAVIAMLYLEHGAGARFEDVHANVWRSYKDGRFSSRDYVDPYKQLDGVFKFGNWGHLQFYDGTDEDPGRTSWKTMINLALEQLGQEYKGEDGDLIDKLAAVLQLPFPANTLSGKVIRQLRQVLLRPDEMAKLAASNLTETQCGVCSRKLNEGEMVTVGRDDGRTILYCHHCVRPQAVACDFCEAPVTLGRGYKNLHSKKVNCGQHTEDGQPLPQPVRPPDAQFGGAVAGRRLGLDLDGPFDVPRPAQVGRAGRAVGRGGAAVFHMPAPPQPFPEPAPFERDRLEPDDPRPVLNRREWAGIGRGEIQAQQQEDHALAMEQLRRMILEEGRMPQPAAPPQALQPDERIAWNNAPLIGDDEG